MCEANLENTEDAVLYALECLGRPSLKLKSEQTQAIESVLAGKDTFVWLPTGHGKFLCFEVIPFAFDYKLRRKNGDFRSLVLPCARVAGVTFYATPINVVTFHHSP